MSATDRELRTVYGTRLDSAGRLSEAADNLERALQASLHRALKAGAGERDDLSEEFDAEFAELPGLARDAYAATARLLRERSDKLGLSEQTYVSAEEANLQSTSRRVTSGEER
ncbi:hypothetical protein GCM10022224_023450 [Nonomuraea antimicrobica]|uniref:Excreted virulence factor EspC, type VII ESX diderm n=1 Tax=Nonomuraea antimicrobica TaxID=561173 RepID=A0ABP7BH89_9ACTN